MLKKVKQFFTHRYLRKHLPMFTTALIGAYGEKPVYTAKQIVDVANGLGIEARYILYFVAYFCTKDEYYGYLITSGGRDCVPPSDDAVRQYFAFALKTVMIDNAFDDMKAKERCSADVVGSGCDNSDGDST